MEYIEVWNEMYQEASPKLKLLMEIISFSYLGIRLNKSHITIEKTKNDTFVNGKKRTDFTYTIKVRGG